MFNASTIYSPRSQEHERLRNTLNGRGDIRTSEAQMGKDILKDVSLADLVQDLYEINIGDRGRWAPYMTVDKPVQQGDEWYIRKYLTETGERALAALDSGWMWDHKALDVAVDQTINYYDAMLNKGTVPIVDCEQLVGNTDERLREIRNRMVYFKMSATKSNNVLKGERVG